MDWPDLLITAIVRQAVNDYMWALKKNDREAIEECEGFFLSKWGQFLTYKNGEKIIKRCRKIVRQQRSKKNGT